MNIQPAAEDDQQLHSGVIHSLSERYHVDESEIRKMYESKLEELSFNATITSFLPVLIERHVKSILQLSPETYS